MNKNYNLQTDPPVEPLEPTPGIPDRGPSNPYPVSDPIPEPNPEPQPFPIPSEPIPQFPPDVVFK